MSDMLTVKEAAEISGRGERTIRRWMADKRLTVQRAEGDKRGTVLLSRQDVIDVASSLTPLPKKKPIKAACKEVVTVLRDHLDDAIHQRDEYQFQVKHLRVEIEDLRQVIDGKQAKIQALEKEINGGVRGLLRRLNPINR